MKLLLILLLTLGSMKTYAADTESELAEKDPCKQMIAYQPQAEDIVYAATVMSIGMTYSACALKDKINLKPSQYIYLQSYSITETGHAFKYKVTTFGKGTLVTEQICETSSHFEHPPGSSLATMLEIFTTPKCSEDVVIQK